MSRLPLFLYVAAALPAMGASAQLHSSFTLLRAGADRPIGPSIHLSPLVATARAAVSKSFLMGKYDYRHDTSFVKVPAAYSKNTVYLQRRTYEAFDRMREAAAKDGVKLVILSGTRSFYDQACKWEGKWKSPKFSGIAEPHEKVTQLLRWWSMPGTSRHHWGTDVDLTNLNISWYTTPAGKKMYEWMQKNAFKYGFVQPFTANRSTGYQEEKWHWSYVPLAKTYLDAYVRNITYADLTGCKGTSVAKDLRIIERWVQGINPECK